MSARLLASLSLGFGVIVACSGQVVLSGYEVAPTNDVKLAVVYRAKPGTSFSDVEEKTLNVSVSVAGRSSSQPAIYLFARQYLLRATDIDWTISWQGPDQGRVDFVSYPPGRGKYEIPELERASLAIPIGHVVVTRRSADRFEISEEQWALPYRTKDYPRGVAK
jgi:hypothetical protein